MEGGARSRIACALSFRRGDLLGDELFRPLRAGSRRSLPGCLGGALLLGLRGGAADNGRPRSHARELVSQVDVAAGLGLLRKQPGRLVPGDAPGLMWRGNREETRELGHE